jgi:probable HAF family extracellular repeat protein
MRTLVWALPAGLCALLGLGVPSANAKIEISSHSISLLNLVSAQGTQVFPAAARAVGPGVIVGVAPASLGNPLGNARGFTIATPASGESIVRVPLLALGTPPVGWLEPWDVNGSGVFVGQARAASASAPRYAFVNRTNGPPYPPLVPGLDDSSMEGQWTASAATAINDRGTVAGWAQRKGGTEQAFYWTGANLNMITIDGATSSRAESISDGGLVAGSYVRGGEQRGFVFDIASGRVTDFGPIAVPTPSSWFGDFRNVSINADGAVAATHVIGSGTDAVNQAFVLKDGVSTPILPVEGYRDSFAAGISDTGWVVGMLRTADGSGQTGFLWYGSGRAIDLSTLDLGGNWVSIDTVYDVYSMETSDPLVQLGTIVGMGTYLEAGTPQQRAFAMQIVLQVPEPHAYVMFGIGLLALGALRVRRQLH